MTVEIALREFFLATIRHILAFQPAVGRFIDGWIARGPTPDIRKVGPLFYLWKKSFADE